MKFEPYNAGWLRLSPIMKGKLAAVSAVLATAGIIADEPTQAGDEEWWLDSTLTVDGRFVGYLQFTLHEDDEGDDLFGIGLRLFGSEAQVHGGWTPGNYTNEAYVPLEQIEERLANMPIDDFLPFVTKSLGIAITGPEPTS